MRFFALQTSIAELKKQFIAEGEEEILTTKHHPIVFVVGMLRAIAFLLLVLIPLVSAFLVLESTSMRLAIGLFSETMLFPFLYLIVKALIDWRFNFLIVTTEKVVIVEHRSFIHQHVNPLHMDNIASTRFESQFLGIFRCGMIHICLKEREGGTTKEITLRYIPKPDVVASAIENAIALEKQRSQQGKSPEEQLPKVQEIQQKIEEKEETAEAKQEAKQDPSKEVPPQQ